MTVDRHGVHRGHGEEALHRLQVEGGFSSVCGRQGEHCIGMPGTAHEEQHDEEQAIVHVEAARLALSSSSTVSMTRTEDALDTEQVAGVSLASASETCRVSSEVGRGNRLDIVGAIKESV